jgi:choline-sulfatase
VLLATAFLAAGSGCERARPARHLVLVTLDTVRADRLGCYGRADAGTPWIDALAARGMRFDRAYTAVPLTLPSHVSILTGRFPPRTGVRLNGDTAEAPGTRTLAEILANEGFFTLAAVGGYPVSSRFPTRRGFEVYDDRLRVGSSGEAVERQAAEVAAAALEGLGARGDRRVFLWLHLFDPHDPYEPPSPYRERFGSDLYQGEIASVDAALASFASRLTTALGDDVLLAVVADHGEALGEHGEDTHGYFLYEATMRVPMLLAGPGVPQGRVVTAPVRTVDLLPTLLRALHVAPPEGLDGHSLLERDAAGGRAYLETLLPSASYGFAPLHGALDGTLKYVSAPRPELYELHADPAESRNVLAERPEDAAALAAWVSSIAGVDTGGTRVPDPRLAGLGYVGAGPIAGTEGLDPKDGLPIYRDFQEAARALEAGRPDDAIPPLRRLLARGETPAVRLKLAQALRMGGKLAEARAELERARGGGTPLPGVHLEAARIGAALEDWHGTLLESEAHLAEDPASAAALLFRGAALEMTGRPAEAEADYRAALRIDTRFRNASLRLAALLVRTGRIDEARTLLAQHLREHPGDQLAAGLLGSL